MSEFDVIRKNFCTDLNLISKLVDAERCLMLAPLTASIRTRAGTCSLGVVATMVDVAGSDPVLAAWSPDWTATQDLSVHEVAPLTDGPVVVDTRILRRGKKVIFVAADIYDGCGVEDLDALKTSIDGGIADAEAPTLCARSLVTFIRIPRSGATGVDAYDPNHWVGTLRKRMSDSDNNVPLNDRVGVTMVNAAAGILEVANTPYVSNSIGTINGGVQAIAVAAAAEAMRSGMIATDMQIHFLSQLKVGPARTSGTLIRDASDHSVVMIQLLDAGAENRLLATATITMRPLIKSA